MKYVLTLEIQPDGFPKKQSFKSVQIISPEAIKFGYSSEDILHYNLSRIIEEFKIKKLL